MNVSYEARKTDPFDGFCLRFFLCLVGFFGDWCADFVERGDDGGGYFPRRVFPHPEPKNFRETAFLSLSKKKIPYFLSFEGKQASFWGGTKKDDPRVVHVLL